MQYYVGVVKQRAQTVRDRNTTADIAEAGGDGDDDVTLRRSSLNMRMTMGWERGKGQRKQMQKPGYACHFCVSRATLQRCGARKQ